MGKKTEATRAERKAKKRAAEDAVPDLPGDENTEVEEGIEKKSKKRKRDVEGEGEESVELEKKMSKKEKKEKKRRREEVEPEAEAVEIEPAKDEKVSKKQKKEKKEKKHVEDEAAVIEEDTAMAGAEAEEAPKKSKKERKAERRAAELAAAAKEASESKTEAVAEPTNGESKPSNEEKKSKKNNRNREKKRKGETTPSTNGEAEATQSKEGKPARFIVFAGNLPFTATKETVTAHFAKVHPSSVRLLTQKDQPAKCKGCAFVEFDGYDHMKTCLKIMHHSMFDDGLSPARKINVELTAGGGGNTKDRKEKIKVKNVKLNEERVRKIHEEEKAKAVKAMEGARTGGAAIDESAIHPSRRRMVPGAA